MKNALILHGSGNDHTGNWFLWLKEELEKKGYEVWVPDLPNSEYPNMKDYLNLIFSNKDFVFNEDTLVVGHSSGAVAIYGILQSLPEDAMIDTAILVGTFDNYPDAKPEYKEYRKGLFTDPFDWEKIKRHAKRIVVIHSDDDPWVPEAGARDIASKLGAEYVMKPNQGHFNLEQDPKYKEFPFLLELLVR